MNIMQLSLWWLSALFIAMLSALSYGCTIEIVNEGSASFDFPDLFRKTVSDILDRSNRQEEELLSAQTIGDSEAVNTFALRHFFKADQIVLGHLHQVRESYDRRRSIFTERGWDHYEKKRNYVLNFAMNRIAALTLIKSNDAFATAFPSGKVYISDSLVRLFDIEEEGFNAVFLGILIHELLHVRKGHALEQWASADNRNALITDTILSAISKLTMLTPGFTYRYNLYHDYTFKSAKKLPELSEYSADLGAIALLEENGFTKEKYISFLGEMSARSTEDKEPFSWLNDRLQCLAAFSTINFSDDVPTIVVGSIEDGDSTLFILDSEARPYRFNRDVTLRITRPAWPANVADGNRTLEKLRRDMFTRCAIQNTFSAIKPVDGMIVIPSFDLTLFFVL